MFKRSDGLVCRIAAGLSVAPGDEFFPCLVRHLADAAEADFAFAGEIAAGSTARVKTLAMTGQSAEIECDLAVTPLGGASDSAVHSYRQGVRSAFPEDPLLAAASAESYAGQKLFNCTGEAIGTLWVALREPVEDPAQIEAVLAIFASRATAELECRRAGRYEQFLAQSKEGYWRIDFDRPVPLSLPVEEALDRYLNASRFAEFNDAMARMLGYESGRSWIGRRPAELEGTEERREFIRQQIRDGFPPTVREFRTVGADGKTRWLERSLVALVESGAVRHAWGIARDTTARKTAEEARTESEERYHTLFEAAGDAIFLVRGECIDCNSRALELYGVGREELIGHTPWQYAPELQPDGAASESKARQKFAQALAGETVAFEWRARKGDGTLFDTEVTLSSFSTAGVPHALALVKDTSGRKKAERQFRDLQLTMERQLAERTAHLEAVNQELESFSYSVSHDLRAAIRGISACSQIVLSECGEKLDGASKQWLEYIHADTEQLDKLTLALLDLSRVSRAGMNLTSISLDAIARTIAERLTGEAPERQARFTISEGMDANGDLVLLQTVMENLIGNAWKFTRKREWAEIEVGFLDSDTKGRVYFVKDNGAGFDMRYADKLFGAFQRLHRGGEFEGVGIGLAKARRIIHRHGGKVWAEGVVDRGTTVFFTLGRPWA